MTRALDAEIAFAMETEEALLAHLPYLLQDLPSLSGDDDDVVDLLRETGLPTGGCVLDLGCGRGGLLIRLAQEFGAQVTGFDGHAGFLAEAVRVSASAGLSGRCQFVAGDLRGALAEDARYDAVLMIAVGPVLGNAAETVGKLRAVAKPGGLIVIGDGYIEDGAPPTEAYADYPDKATMEAGLTRFGETIVARRERGPGLAAFNALTLKMVPKRAEALKTTHPELAADLDAYVARQFEEVALMDGPIVPTIWALRRAAV